MNICYLMSIHFYWQQLVLDDKVLNYTADVLHIQNRSLYLTCLTMDSFISNIDS